MKPNPVPVILGLSFALLLTGFARPADADPKLIVVSPKYEAGQNPAGTAVKHDFIVKNEGRDPLIIERVVPGCGCTLASFDSFIAPGRTGKISVNVDLYREWAGQEFLKTVTVISNDPENSRVRLAIHGTVGQPGNRPAPRPVASAAPRDEPAADPATDTALNDIVPPSEVTDAR
ncbi:MAG: DUF1573 domain-containing protein [Deltaproteobacteria bacterium]|jgi:hypothetical protein|nr:DUF1573 domain-containing protein [Deltaproteobacteria bacterium]